METQAQALRRRFEKMACPVFVFEGVCSTNDLAKEKLLEGAPHGAAVVATSQTAGRGRLDRAFSSGEGGLYLSFIYNKPLPRQVATLPFSAALACAKALERVCDVHVGLKWVNDLFIGEKKVGGILVEGVICPQTGKILGAVIGVGINVENTLPETLLPIATSLKRECPAPPALVQVVEQVLLALRETFKDVPDLPIGAYRERMLFVGKEVQAHDGKESFFATVLGIDENGALLVRKKDGTTAALTAGEVTLHKEI